MKGRRSGMGSMLVELFKKKQLGTQGISGPIILGGAMKRGGVLKAKKGKSVLNAKQYRKYLKGLKAVGKYPGIRTAGALKQSMKDASKAGVKGFLERRAKLAGTTVKGIERAAKATRIGKIALGIAAAGLGAKEYLKRKMKKNEKRPQRKMGGGMMKKPMMMSGGLSEATQKLKAQGKMGGGMMQRPMMAMGGGMMPGYKKGKSVMAKGCKLGRKKPTKMYT